MKGQIIDQFNSNKARFESFGEKMELLIREILIAKKIKIHSITHRVKDLDSLSKKIDLNNNKYKSLFHITDLVGIRIITHLDSDVDRIASILGREFRKDNFNTVDKRKLRSNEFGYKSYHQILACSRDRYELIEYQNFDSLVFELQIRTILQHAWAEIVHKLDYKSEEAIPEEYKRNFNRIAALLETADVEFDRLTSDLDAYKNNAENILKDKTKELIFDKVILSAFLSNNLILSKAMRIISNVSGCELIEDDKSWRFIHTFNEFFNIYTINDLEDKLNDNQEGFLSFIKEFSKEITVSILDKSVVFYYLLHFLACLTDSTERQKEYCKHMSLADTNAIFDHYQRSRES